ncbi:hypothetical protein [Thalassotalea piscium]|uniref:Uncharacterized protein n=1 Tax=Thalassotalea piscium TaxID=1230533 RepID=A0A7X0NG09_9GAMM|nr:hypothetical protein [Thalassotalea piscium]MBB6542786.1 hypothetical protein [Thalassotalea piscium]
MFIGLVIGYFYIVDQHIIIDRTAPFSYRQFLLETSADTQGKVIVESGSNSVHSIDPFLLVDYFNAPAITSADNAGYPLQLKIYNLLKVVKTGDVVILPLEWNQYSYNEQLPDNFLTALADKNLKLEYYFNNLPFVEKMKFVFTQYPLKSALTSLFIQRNKGELLREDLKRLSKFDILLGKNSNETYGNSERNGLERIEKDGSHNKSCDQYVLDAQLSKGFMITDVFKDNLERLLLLKDKGVKVYFTWPTVVDGKDSTCYTGKIAKRELPGFAHKIKVMIENKGFEFIGDYKDNRFSSECFLNTYYHIKKECAQTRTTRLVKAFAERNVLPIDNTSTLEPFLKKTSEKLAKIRDDIANTLIKTYSTISKESISGSELPNKVLFVKGWSFQQKAGVWSIGKESIISFLLENSLLKQPIINITLDGEYYNGTDKTEVLINGKSMGFHVLKNRTFSLPSQRLTTNNLIITLRHSNIKSPFELNKSKDKRKIKFYFKRITVD